jgi:hypothetical protein
VELSGLSRRELARRLGSDYPMRRILRRDKHLRIGQLLLFADAVEIRPGELFSLAFDDGTVGPSPLLRRLLERSRRLQAVLGRLDPEATGAADAEPPAKENGPR